MVTTTDRLLAVILLMMLGAVPAAARSIHRCIASDGHVSLQDQPCAQGSRSREIPVATFQPSPPSATPSVQPGERPRQRAFARPRSAEPRSYRCRTESGLLFYRHGRCPAAVVDPDRAERRKLPVMSEAIGRREACRAMRNTARNGDELDERPSTYDRNLGRDPCRGH